MKETDATKRASRTIPYGRQWIDETDIQAVNRVLGSDWLTTGPKVDEFERAFSNVVGARQAVAVSSGTAALHTAVAALGIRPGDEVIVPPITFVATANAVVFQGGTPVFADVQADTLLLDPEKVEEKITKRTRAIVGVDYAGQPCDWDRLRQIADAHGLSLIADSCHALGGRYKGRNVGTLADLTVFSFHPVKHITTGEGGMITTGDPEAAERMRRFRNHGINSDHATRTRQGTWYYEMVDLGFNYRITDFQCALGLSQLKKLPFFLERRRDLARQYDKGLNRLPGLTPLHVRAQALSAYHLYVIKVGKDAGMSRAEMFEKLRNKGVGVNVHYIPVHLHPFYRNNFGTGQGLCPEAERAYEKILSLPLYPGMTEDETKRVIDALDHLPERNQ